MTAEERKLLSLRAELLADIQAIEMITEGIASARSNIHLAKEPALLVTMGIAALIHHFYSATESAFQRIVKYFDGGMPTGESWHRELLAKVAMEVPGIRPAVIDRDLQKQLDDYRRFRHLFRNVYELNLDWDKLVVLLNRLPAVHEALKQRLRQFTEFIAVIAGDQNPHVYKAGSSEKH